MDIQFGITRMVILVGPLALKFPRPWFRWRNQRLTPFGMYGNMLESQTWAEGEAEERKWLGRIYLTLPYGLLVVMRRHPKLGRSLTEAEWRECPWLGFENKASSLGLRNGRFPVIIDYGEGMGLKKYLEPDDPALEYVDLEVATSGT